MFLRIFASASLFTRALALHFRPPLPPQPRPRGGAGPGARLRWLRRLTAPVGVLRRAGAPAWWPSGPDDGACAASSTAAPSCCTASRPRASTPSSSDTATKNSRMKPPPLPREAASGKAPSECKSLARSRLRLPPAGPPPPKLLSAGICPAAWAKRWKSARRSTRRCSATHIPGDHPSKKSHGFSAGCCTAALRHAAPARGASALLHRRPYCGR